jgi:Protein of unknown function (Hypoth_ymh)
MLAVSTLRTDTEKSEQTGFANLLKGMFGTFRNPTGHAPKVTWKIEEQDALDLLSLVSYLHHRLDAAAIVQELAQLLRRIEKLADFTCAKTHLLIRPFFVQTGVAESGR